MRFMLRCLICVTTLLALAGSTKADDEKKQAAPAKEASMLKIQYASVPVDDQEKALKFYTETLGFVKKADIPLGEFRWITVVSADNQDGVELALEPNENPVVKAFQEGLKEQGIPATAFVVDDIEATMVRLKEAGVEFKSGPTEVPGAIVAMFDDTCGNLIMISQQ